MKQPAVKKADPMGKDMGGMAFPMPDRGEAPLITHGKLTYSYLDSFGSARTETKPALSAQQIIELVKQRMMRFDRAGPGARESDFSRRERKYITAHPIGLLKAAWARADKMTRMEMAMMFDPNSHYGNSSRAWVEKNQRPHQQVIGDDGAPLN